MSYVMDVEFLSAVRSLSSLRQEPELESALSELLAKVSGKAPLTIKGARDKFSEVNRLAKSGQIQVVKGAPGEETVIVSIKSLAAIIRALSATLSFGDALAAAGFQPTGHRLVQSEGFKRDSTLVLEIPEDAKNANSPAAAV
jgi:hypothetical protein